MKRLVSIEVFHHSFISMKRGSDTETVEKERKNGGGDWSLVSKSGGRRRIGAKRKT